MNIQTAAIRALRRSCVTETSLESGCTVAAVFVLYDSIVYLGDYPYKRLHAGGFRVKFSRKGGRL